MGLNSKTYKQFVEILNKHGFRVTDDIVIKPESPMPPLAKLSVKSATLTGEPDRKFNEFRVVTKMSWRVDAVDNAIKRMSDVRVMCKKEGITFVSCDIFDNEAEVCMGFLTHASID